MSAAPPATVLYLANAGIIGGGNRVLMDLMQNLDPARFRPVLVSPAHGELTRWAHAAGVPVSVCRDGDWHGAAPLARRTLALGRLILRERPAIVHASAHTCYRALGVAGRLLGRIRVCHLGFPPAPGELRHAFVSAPEAVIGCYEGQAHEHADEIRRIDSRTRVVGIPNGINVQRFRPMAPGPHGVLRAGVDHVVAILGHVSDVKGHPVFVEAAAAIARRFPRTRFIAIGGENLQPGLRERLEARGRVLGLGDRLQFLGFRQDVEHVLAAADVVVLPSQAEGFPLAVLEAMACGKPVVATDVGGVAEAIEPGVTGLLLPGQDAASLAAAVEGLLADPARRQRIGHAARVRIEGRFSVQIFAGEVQRLYSDLVCRTGAVPAAAAEARA